jgi:hypothetical protein
LYKALTSDVSLTASVTDVRCRPGATPCGSANAADGADYTGEVQLDSTVRITDRINGTYGSQPATVQDIDFPVTFGCVNTAATNIGGSCTTTTSFNAVVPGAIVAGKRAIWQLGQVQVNDGGADGVASTNPNSVFERQGIFIP